jgi:hypothetical protein
MTWSKITSIMVAGMCAGFVIAQAAGAADGIRRLLPRGCQDASAAGSRAASPAYETAPPPAVRHLLVPR